jgi:DNA invertase Pin-like site-specific DNA recombinase
VKAAIYARVSTTDKGQDINLQLNDLKPYCERRGWTYTEYVDNGVSGAKEKRPAFEQLMTDAKKKQFDVIVVWKLDRFSRSLQHLITTLNDLQKLSIDFVSYNEHIDFTTATGRLMIHIIAAFAQFERELMAERIKAGMQNAKAKGVKIGRKPKAPIEISKIIQLYEEAKQKGENISVREISKKTKIGKSTVHSVIKDYTKGLIDKDGFAYEKPLIEANPSLFD